MFGPALNRSPKFRGLLAAGMLIVLAGCSESRSTLEACQSKLDNRQYSDVANDSACSNYQRASAELGLAGFSTSKILNSSSNGSLNVVTALGLTAANCRLPTPNPVDDLTKKSYSSTYQQRFLRAQYYSRDLYAGQSRTSDLIEISFIATLADILVDSQCRLDTNLDGTISDAESQDFLGLATGVPSTSTILDYCDFQLIAPPATGGRAYILHASGNVLSPTPPAACGNTPDQFAADTDYDGLPNGTYQSIAVLPSSTFGSGALLYRLARVDAVGALFQPGKDPTVATQFLGDVARKAGQMNQDLSDLGLPADSDLRKSIRDAIATLDNGGSCTKSSLTLVGLLEHLTAAAAHDSQTSYSGYNLLPTTDVVPSLGGIASAFTLPASPSIGGVSLPSVTAIKLVYNTSSTPSPLYVNATSAVKDGLEQLKGLLLRDDYGNYLPGNTSTPTWDRVRPSVAGDNNITLRELACSH